MFAALVKGNRTHTQIQCKTLLNAGVYKIHFHNFPQSNYLFFLKKRKRGNYISCTHPAFPTDLSFPRSGMCSLSRSKASFKPFMRFRSRALAARRRLHLQWGKKQGKNMCVRFGMLSILGIFLKAGHKKGH